ncbi:queuosine precursor transporter [Methanobrevibacter curvatus]|uniref:Probable queuosine precursor transporter n=1 Tax=Methanobrevibacter curvatus TaxID=49547 RepID=A0A166CQ65_9EURY|nr:queuosine precursor transporter [Methanobrevibacter curvatus]KZX14753.1 inner membrane protein YhhQ [Methanobrevibacter curvatus]
MAKKENILMKEKMSIYVFNKLKTSKPQVFAYLTALFATILIVSNLASTKMFDFFSTGLVWDGGAVLFPLSYILGDVITEIFGFEKAKKVIWTAFVMNLIAVLALFFVQILPPGPGWEHQIAYETIIGFMPRIVAGSLIAFVSGQILNSYVFVKIKEITNGKRFWQRAIGSSLVGDLVDTVIFTTIAFFGTISTFQFFGLLTIAYLTKIIGETVLLPVTYGVVKFCEKIMINENDKC